MRTIRLAGPPVVWGQPFGASGGPGTWRPVVWSELRPPAFSDDFAMVTCANGHECTLSRKVHAVASDGTISPSLVCPVDGCNDHYFGRLEGWPAISRSFAFCHASFALFSAAFAASRSAHAARSTRRSSPSSTMSPGLKIGSSLISQTLSRQPAARTRDAFPARDLDPRDEPARYLGPQVHDRVDVPRPEHQSGLRGRWPREDELTYALGATCDGCGAPMAYQNEIRPNAWDCADVLLGRVGTPEDPALVFSKDLGAVMPATPPPEGKVVHTRLPFWCWSVKADRTRKTRDLPPGRKPDGEHEPGCSGSDVPPTEPAS